MTAAVTGSRITLTESEKPLTVVKTQSELFPKRPEWKKPGTTTPATDDLYRTVDQVRAVEDIDALVLGFVLNQVKNALDVGSVTGNSTYHLYTKLAASIDSQSARYVLGIDCQENVDFALETYVPRAISNRKNPPVLDFKVTNSPFDIPFAPDGELWDLMTAWAMFSWVPLEHQWELMKAMYDKLADGGTLAARTEAMQPRYYREAIDEVMKLPKWQKYFAGYEPAYQDQTVEGFRDDLLKAGFKNPSVVFREQEYRFINKSAMAMYFLQWLPELSYIQGEDSFETDYLHVIFTEEVIDAFCRLSNCDGTNIPLIFPCVFAIAKKDRSDLY